MRIGTYNMLSQIYGNQPVKKSGKTQSASGASFMDEVSFSSKGKDLQVAKTAVAQTPDVRSSKVAALKAQYESGTYNVSGEDFAEKLISAFEARA